MNSRRLPLAAVALGCLLSAPLGRAEWGGDISPTQTPDGARTVFSTSQELELDSLLVFVNGVRILPATVESATYTLPDLVQAGEAIHHRYEVVGASLLTWGADVQPATAPNGAETLFSTGDVFDVDSLLVFLNGVYQTEEDTPGFEIFPPSHYAFQTPVPAGEEISHRYVTDATDATDAYWHKETPTEVPDGSRTEFSLAIEPYPDSVLPFVNGLFNVPTVSGNTLVLPTPPATGDRIVVHYVAGTSGLFGGGGPEEEPTPLPQSFLRVVQCATCTVEVASGACGPWLYYQFLAGSGSAVMLERRSEETGTWEFVNVEAYTTASGHIQDTLGLPGPLLYRATRIGSGAVPQIVYSHDYNATTCTAAALAHPPILEATPALHGPIRYVTAPFLLDLSARNQSTPTTFDLLRIQYQIDGTAPAGWQIASATAKFPHAGDAWDYHGWSPWTASTAVFSDLHQGPHVIFFRVEDTAHAVAGARGEFAYPFVIQSTTTTPPLGYGVQCTGRF